MNDIMTNIQILQEKLNEMVIDKSNPADIYTLSTELDNWIVMYYKQK